MSGGAASAGHDPSSPSPMAGSVREWREQYDRMKRWRTRLHEATIADDRFIDDCYAFFTCCFHLKDWLKADRAVPQKTRDKVEEYVESNLWLRLCADLANGSKHMILKQRARYSAPARVEKVGIIIAGRIQNPRRAADRCVSQWDVFLQEQGLPGAAVPLE